MKNIQSNTVWVHVSIHMIPIKYSIDTVESQILTKKYKSTCIIDEHCQYCLYNYILPRSIWYLIKYVELSDSVDYLLLSQMQNIILQLFNYLLINYNKRMPFNVSVDALWDHITYHISPMKSHIYSESELKQIELYSESELKQIESSSSSGTESLSPASGMMNYNGYIVPASCQADRLILSQLNKHERDKFITFDEKPHIYYLKGKRVTISVTGWIHQSFNEFEPHKAIFQMLSSKKFPYAEKHKKYLDLPIWGEEQFDSNGVYSIIPIDEWHEGAVLRSMKETEKAMIDLWSKISTVASTLGTKMHLHCELYLNSILVDDKTREFQHFLRFQKWIHDQGYKPYRTEQVIYDEDIDLSGSVDYQAIEIASEHEYPKKIALIDWKRYSRITYTNTWQKGIGLLSEWDDCNISHAVFQLNSYRFILEKHYGVKVIKNSILVFHPQQDNFIEIPVEDKQELIAKKYEERRQQVLNGEHITKIH
jgi:hypothetical protein